MQKIQNILEKKKQLFKKYFQEIVCQKTSGSQNVPFITRTIFSSHKMIWAYKIIVALKNMVFLI